MFATPNVGGLEQDGFAGASTNGLRERSQRNLAADVSFKEDTLQVWERLNQ